MISSVTAVVLCGGKSTRMGRDKADLVMDGVSFLDLTISKLSSFCSNIIVSGRSVPGFLCVDDVFKGCGPLGGIHAGLSACTSPWAFVISCDMPLFKPSVAEVLSSHAGCDVQAIVPVTPDGRVQSLCAFYRFDVAPVAASCLDSGRCAIRALLDSIRTVYVPFSDSRPFVNINTAEDYERLCL